MLNRFDDNPTNAARALQIWLVLIGKAHNRQTITYGIPSGDAQNRPLRDV